MYTDLALYIDGKWHNGSGRKGEDVLNPATEKPLAHLPHASKADLDEALEAAKKGFALWRATSAYDRAKIMRKAADLMRERHDAISKVMVQEQGKVYAEARAEVITSADIIDWYAEEGRRSYGRIVPGRAKGTRQLVVQEPVGVVAAFTPWNFPVLTPARKVGGALAAGCSLILKASEETPGACVEMVRCFADAGLPGRRAQPGVRRAGGSLRASAREGRRAQDLLHRLDPGRQASRRARRQRHETHHHGARRPFAGRGVRRRRSRRRRPTPSPRSSTAMPGRSASRRPASTCRRTSTRNSSRASRNMPRASSSATVWRKASPWDRWRMRAGIDAMESFVADAKSRGGKVVTGGKRGGNQGFFYEPTIVTEVPDDSKVMTQEPFGPIAPIVTFKTFDEVVERANSLPFGLAAYAFTSSNSTAAAIGDAIESGMVGVNSIAISTPETPFGGVKESGHGSEGGIEGLGAYLNTKFISQG